MVTLEETVQGTNNADIYKDELYQRKFEKKVQALTKDEQIDMLKLLKDEQIGSLKQLKVDLLENTNNQTASSKVDYDALVSNHERANEALDGIIKLIENGQSDTLTLTQGSDKKDENKEEKSKPKPKYESETSSPELADKDDPGTLIAKCIECLICLVQGINEEIEKKNLEATNKYYKEITNIHEGLEKSITEYNKMSQELKEIDALFENEDETAIKAEYEKAQNKLETFENDSIKKDLMTRIQDNPLNELLKDKDLADTFNKKELSLLKAGSSKESDKNNENKSFKDCLKQEVQKSQDEVKKDSEQSVKGYYGKLKAMSENFTNRKGFFKNLMTKFFKSDTVGPARESNTPNAADNSAKESPKPAAKASASPKLTLQGSGSG